MRHQGTRQIETNRLILRQFSIDDAEKIFNNWASDADVTRYLSWKPHKNIANTRQIIEDWQNRAVMLDDYNWCIEEKACGEPIGNIGVVALMEDIDAVEIGCCIGKRWWNKGIATEAFSAIIDFFFSVVGANRIVVRYDLHNAGSAAVACKCKLTVEGIARDGARDSDGLVDTAVASILRREWIKNKT